MNTKLNARRRSSGYVLLLTMIFTGIATMLLMTAMSWTSSTTRNTDRNNEYYTSAAAAEAATEKILVRMTRDYLTAGEGGVDNTLSSYKSVLPTSTDNGYWTNYTFRNPEDGSSGVYVTRSTNSQYLMLDGQYKDLYGYRATYRITANAQLNNSHNANLVAAVKQEIGLESIPIFQFAIFYNEDLEMNPNPPMVVTGRVHANGNIFTDPANSLTFSNDVTASGFITNSYMPADPSGPRSAGPPNVNFLAAHDAQTSTLNLPLGTNGSSANVNQILQLPPNGESASSAMGTNRFYNKADLVILLYDTNTIVQSGPGLGTPVNVPTNQWTNWLCITNIFYNKRESTNVRTARIDVGKFKTWAENTTNLITPKLHAKTTINIVYVADFRNPFVVTNVVTNWNAGHTSILGYTSNGFNVQAAVYLTNGSVLPNNGLTVATSEPIYVCGDYNTTDGSGLYSKSTNTTVHTLPAAVLGDSINILSTAWNDANSSKSLSSGQRAAADTTVNAAFLAGIVPTGTYGGTAYYSGGVENFPRFLEDWGGKTFWYNGSMVVMFNSLVAQAPWGGNSDTYNPPIRKWAFDTNFYQQNKLPPGTPQILFMERLDWSFVPPNYTGP